MRVATKNHPKWAWRLTHWLVDTQYEIRPLESGGRVLHERANRLGALLDKIDPGWEWQGRLIEEPGRWLICKLFGHLPMDDMCMRPDHRFCAACNRPTPHERVVR